MHVTEGHSGPPAQPPSPRSEPAIAVRVGRSIISIVIPNALAPTTVLHSKGQPSLDWILILAPMLSLDNLFCAQRYFPTDNLFSLHRPSSVVQAWPGVSTSAHNGVYSLFEWIAFNQTYETHFPAFSFQVSEIGW